MLLRCNNGGCINSLVFTAHISLSLNFFVLLCDSVKTVEKNHYTI